MTPPLRLMINALHAKAGGGVTYLRNMLPLLADDDRLEVHLVIHRGQRELFDPIDERIRIREEIFPSSFLTRIVWEQFVVPLRALAMGARVTFSPANFCPLLAPGPVILLRNTVEAAATETRPVMKLYWHALRLITTVSLLRCRCAIAVSAYARDILASGVVGSAKGKVTVVPHGVNALFTPAVPRRGREPFLLAVGTIYQQKNLHRLIEAFVKVRERVPDITLVVAGGTTPEGEGYFRSLTMLVTRLGLDKAVTFVGEKKPDELVELYRRCVAFVFPSTAETFGQPLAEAMACGAPVVCSNVTAMPEVVGDAACMFDPLDVDDIAEQIMAVLGDPVMARVLSERGLARASRFSWPETARRTADVLIAAANRPNRAFKSHTA